MRNGLWMTGSGGSGILIARKSDGTWSPPSGIMLHTPTLSFIIGVDIYDCVLVISNLAALESITRPRVTLGEDVGLENGPCVPLDADEPRLSWKDLGNSVLAYMKARGQHQAVNLNGCILTERANENERFYSSGISQMDILAGNVARHVEETKPLFEVIKMAEGRTDYDKAVIDKTAIQPAPGDALIETPKGSTPVSPRFGFQKADDPDPFGILALEMAGLEIREAGSRARPTSSQLDLANGPLSPALSKFSRQSTDTRSNRGSYMSTRTVRSQGTDAGTRTGTRNTPETSPSPRRSDEDQPGPSDETDPLEIDYTTVDTTPLRHISQEYANGVNLPEDATRKADSPSDARRSPSPTDTPAKDDTPAKTTAENAEDDEDEDEDEDGDDEDEEPVVYEVAAVQPTRTQAVASRVIHARGNVVTIAKRVPPPLPRRSPARMSRLVNNESGNDLLSIKSPLRQAFSEADLRDDDDQTADNSGDRADDVKSMGDIDETRAVSPMGQVLDDTAPPSTEPDHVECKDDAESVPDVVVDGGNRVFVADVDTATEAVPKSTSEEDLSTRTHGDDESVDDASEYMDADEHEMDGDSSDDMGSEILEAEFSLMKPAAVVHVRKSAGSAHSIPTKQLPSHVEESGAQLDHTQETPEDALDFNRRDSGPTVTQLLGINGHEDDSEPCTPHNEHTDVSDSASNTKHSSSIYTGITDDRWSYDGSSPTTPTSERPSSMSGDLTDGTPTKKGSKDIEVKEDVSSESGGITPTATTVS